MENGRMIWQMEKEYIYIKMVLNIMENGKMICNMAKERNIGLMELGIQDSTFKAWNMDLESLFGNYFYFQRSDGSFYEGEFNENEIEGKG